MPVKNEKDSEAYRDDALLMSRGTTGKDIKEFLLRRIRDPVEVDGIVVWNFSNHVVDQQALEEAAYRRLEGETYVIPYQVTGAWGFMEAMLPPVVNEAEVLVYKDRYSEYVAYENYKGLLDEEEIAEFRENVEDSIDALEL